MKSKVGIIVPAKYIPDDTIVTKLMEMKKNKKRSKKL